MLDRLKKIGNFARSVQGLLYIVATVIPTVLTYIIGIFEGIPWSSRIPLALASAAAGFATVYYAMRTYHYISERYGFRKEVNGVADNLQALLDANNEYLKLQVVADMWAGDDKEKLWVWNPRLRKLKEGIDTGQIEYVQEGRQNPSRRTPVKIEDVIKYLRNLKSLELTTKPETP